MSVKSFLGQCYDSDLDFSNLDVDDFIICIKRLNQILTKDIGKNVRERRKRRYNSVLANYISMNDKFDENKISDLYNFNDDIVRIDICIRMNGNKKFYFVAVTGSWRPNKKALDIHLANYNLNYECFFDYPEVSEISFDKGSCQFFGGSDFPVDSIGFDRIHRLFTIVVCQYLTYCDRKYENVR